MICHVFVILCYLFFLFLKNVHFVINSVKITYFLKRNEIKILSHGQFRLVFISDERGWSLNRL